MDIYCWKYRYETVQSESLVNNQKTYWLQECLPESKINQPQRILLLNNLKFKNPNRQFMREVNQQLKEEWNSPSADQNLCKQFTDDEIIAAIKSLKAGKALGTDNLHPEFILGIHENCIQWLRLFFNVCLHTKKVPKIWKLAKLVAVLKPKKPPNVASSYRPVSLLCVPSKLYERLIYNCIQPIAESVLPKEQAGFRPGCFSQDQVVYLQKILNAILTRSWRQALCFLTFLQHMTLYGTVVLHLNC